MFVSASTTCADASTSFSAISMASRDKNCVLEYFRAGEGLLTDSKEPLHLQLLWRLMVPIPLGDAFSEKENTEDAAQKCPTHNSTEADTAVAAVSEGVKFEDVEDLLQSEVICS